MDSGAGMRLVRNTTLHRNDSYGMSYKVLARKWRPQHFRDMLGQEPVLRALVNALDSNRLHHAYLFTGMRGVGKTTIARIFAKCLNCETNGVTSDPCGTCSACQDIDAGRFFDLIEVDAASRTKVESTRELLENVPYAPASGRYKVYLIDEVHMFSTHSFNALLKTLEEPPEHVKFLLATTDPQKVPATVLSRCLQFNLKRMSPNILTEYLSKILVEESIEHEMPALDLIARASEGSVRDALSLVEQAAASGEGAIRALDVESMLGRASVDRLLGLIETLATGDMPALFEQVEELAQYAPEFEELLGELLSLLHRVAMLRTVPGSVADTSPGYERLAALAAQLDPDVVQLFYQVGLHARRDMPFAPDTREAFDMALLRMNAFKPQGSEGGGAGGGAPAGQLPSESASGGVAATQHSDAGVSAAPQASGGSNISGAQSALAALNSDVPPQPSLVAPAADVKSTPSTSAEPAAKPPGLAVRGSVSAGGAMRAAALAVARGETLPEPIAQQVAQIMAQTAPDAAEALVASNASKPGSGPSGADSGVASESVESTPTAKPDNTVSGNSQPASQDSQPAAAASMVAVLDSQPPTSASPAAPVVAALDKSAVTAADWPQLVSELDIAGMPLQLANNCTFARIDAGRVHLQLEESSAHLMENQLFVERLQNSLGQWFGHDVTVSIELVGQTLETPAKLAAQQTADELAAAHDSIKLDPIVRQLIDKVDAAVDESSIRPLH